MGTVVVIIIIFCIFIMINNMKFNIDYKSFFKKGFQKLDNKFGITCYTGKQGKGKTYSAIKFCIEQQKIENYLILTNVKSFYKSIDNAIFFEDIQDMIKYCLDEFEKPEEERKKILIFFDEIFTCLEKAGSLKKEILSFLSQLRKRKILLVTTAQEWAEIQITFRRYIRFQISCNMISLPFTKTAVLINNVNDGDQIHWDNDSQDFVAPLIQTNIAKGNIDIIEKYDTFETIQTTNSLNKERK